MSPHSAIPPVPYNGSPLEKRNLAMADRFYIEEYNPVLLLVYII